MVEQPDKSEARNQLSKARNQLSETVNGTLLTYGQAQREIARRLNIDKRQVQGAVTSYRAEGLVMPTDLTGKARQKAPCIYAEVLRARIDAALEHKHAAAVAKGKRGGRPRKASERLLVTRPVSSQLSSRDENRYEKP